MKTIKLVYQSDLGFVGIFFHDKPETAATQLPEKQLNRRH